MATGVGVHDKAVLGAFQDGDPRMVFARYREDPARRYFLKQGSVSAEVRDFTRNELECLIPDCPDSRLHVVSRAPRARDGFSHYGGAGNHGAESVFHQQAKALLVKWLNDSDLPVTAVEEVATEGRERIADVMATWPDGQRVAFEVQYATLTPQEWRVRHESYAAMGIPCVWLLGHLPTHLKQTREQSWLTPKDAFSLAVSPLHTAMLEAGVPLLWINPVTGQIATAETIALANDVLHLRGRLLVGQCDERRWSILPTPDSEPVLLHVDYLAACTPTPSGMNVPRWEALTANRSALDATNTQIEAQNAALERRAAELARQAAEKAERDRATLTQRKNVATRLSAERESKWRESELHASIIAKYGRIPQVIAVEHQPDFGVFEAREHWHAIVYRDLIHQRIGETFSIGDVYRKLGAANIALHKDGSKRAPTILSYLEALESLRYVDIEYGDEGWKVQRVHVRADLITPPAPMSFTRPMDDEDEPPSPSRKERRAQREAAEQPLKPSPAAPKPADPMPEYSAALGYVRHYLPGIENVQMWHRPAVDILREQSIGSVAELRELLGRDSEGVADDMLLRALRIFRRHETA